MRKVVHNAVAWGACRSAEFEIVLPWPGAGFGATVRLAKSIAEELPNGLPKTLADAGGLLLIPGLNQIAAEPELLLRLSRLFGPEIEDYRYLLTSQHLVHESVPEIFLVTNMVANYRPPPLRPEPPLTADGKFPVQYPQRRGWHTDPSYRRPTPDISLFFAVNPVARERGQTLFASGTLAYDARPAALKAKVENLQGLHAQPGTGRGRSDAEAGKTPRPFAPHDRSHPHPVPPPHPVTPKKALYLS